jgi:hypothetical protein
MIRRALLLSILVSPAMAQPPLDPVTQLCATNPAYSPSVMSAVLSAQLAKDHDEALDAEPPAQMAAEAAALGIKDCAADLNAHPDIVRALTGLSPVDEQVAWDAYNTTCSDRASSKADCIKAESGSAQALRHMAQTNQPPGAQPLVQACGLILTSGFAMAEWRLCVDQALAVHATPDKARQCKTSVNWHVAKTGAQAGAILAACLKG